jgi:hypothetical protein
MSAYEDVLVTVKYVRDRTGDPNAWQAGLAPSEVAAVITPTTRPEQLSAILHKIREQHASLFAAGASGGPTKSPVGVLDAPSGREEGDAAAAMADAEAALAHQNSASSQLDMQVISAILNAHLKAVDGREALIKLQRETESAVVTRSDLDTPAGARDFQRFLIGKLKDIRAVVLNASLDDMSKSALMAAWTSLYDASKGGSNDPGDRPRVAAAPVAPAAGPGQQSLDDPDTGWDPLLDPMLVDDPGAPDGNSSGAGSPPGAAPAAMPMPPTMPTIPGLGTAPGSMGGWGMPGGLPLSWLEKGGRPDPPPRELADEVALESREPDPGDHGSPEEAGNEKHDNEDAPADKPESPPGPTTVTLPDGETVTAASPQLAAVIQTAVAGAPIADAFHQQGITIPPPGTAVTNPVEPRQVLPGDVGMFTDRHALALGHEKALLDGQIQHIATVSGPNFLGWEHPPAATAPAKPGAPTPTRPATASAV